MFPQTSSAASFLVYEIAKQPEIQERLVEEITSVVGEKEHPSWDDLQKMTLLRNCAGGHEDVCSWRNPVTNHS